MLKRANIRRVLAQPDWLLVILSSVFLWAQQRQGYKPPYGVAFWVLVFSLEAVFVHAWELRSVLTRRCLLYRGRSSFLWAIALMHWILASSLTGGLRSPLLYLILLSVLHHMRNPRRQRYTVAALLLLGSFLAPPLLNVRLGWELPAYQIPSFYMGMLCFSLLGLLAYGLFFSEHRPIDIEFLSSLASSWTGGMTKENLYRAVLARAIRLYQADWGVVSERSTSAGLPLVFRVCCSVGKGIDDPYESVCLDAEFSEFVKKQKDAYRRWFVHARRMEWASNHHFRSVFSFAVRRVRTREVIAIFTLFSRKRFRAILPQSLYYLDMLRTEAETACEVLTYTYCYRQLLLAKNQDEFCVELRRTTQKLVPLSAGEVDVKLSVSPSRPALEQAIVPVSVQLHENRLRPRWVTAKATIEKPDMCTLHAVYSYLKDVASASIVEQRMHTEESLNASDRGPIGLADLEPPNKEFARKLMEWDPSSDSYEVHFENCGFRVLRVNRLMHAWFPTTDCNLDECEREVFCYNLYNSPEQKSPCFNCPCVYLYKRYLSGQSPDEIREILRSLEVRTSYSPAGRLQVMRFFELAASLIANPLAPPESDRNDCISFIREMVIDRTLEVEVLAILTDIAKRIELFPSRTEGGTNLDRQHYDDFAEKMFGIAVEGLGRAFQANHAMRLRIQQSQACVDKEYVCRWTDQKSRKSFVESELEAIRQARGSIQRYFQTRTGLYVQEPNTPGGVPPQVFLSLAGRHFSCRERWQRAPEIMDTAIPELFKWSSREKSIRDSRCILVNVPATEWVLCIFTGEPEGWEIDPGGRLLPREMELELCQTVGNMLGLLFEAIANALEWTQRERFRAKEDMWRRATAAFTHRLNHILPLAMSSFLKIQMSLDSREAISRRTDEGQEAIRRALYLIARFSRLGMKRALTLETRTLFSLMQEIQKMLHTDYANLPLVCGCVSETCETERVLVDVSTFKDIFAMLVDDSVRYHPDNKPHIQIDFGHSQGGQPKAVIVYRDDGPGIPDDLKEKVFEAFFSTSRDGTGIGLADIRSSVVAHGGTICENGECGNGVRFEIALPLVEKGV